MHSKSGYISPAMHLKAFYLNCFIVIFKKKTYNARSLQQTVRIAPEEAFLQAKYWTLLYSNFILFAYASVFFFCRKNQFAVSNPHISYFTEQLAVHVTLYVMNISNGGYALFTCNASGSPRSNITWTNMLNREVYAGGQFEIKNAKRNDNGNCQCTANNGISRTVTDTAFLNVYCK